MIQLLPDINVEYYEKDNIPKKIAEIFVRDRSITFKTPFKKRSFNRYHFFADTHMVITALNTVLFAVSLTSTLTK